MKRRINEGSNASREKGNDFFLVYHANFNEIEYPENGFLVLGSESHGIAEELLAFTKNKITIPRYGKAESLNVSVAAGILCQKWIS